MRMLSLLFVMFLFLGGCRLVSDEPLLDAASGLPVYGDTFLAYGIEDDSEGIIALDKSAAPEMMAFEHENGGDGPGAYIMAGMEKRTTLSFHPLPDQDLMLVQMASEGSDAVYALVDARPERLLAQTIALDTKRRDALATLGFDVKNRDGDVAVGDVRALDAAVMAFIEAKDAGSLFDSPAFDLVIAQGEANAIRALGVVMGATCLALAGHPHDPTMRSLSPDHRAGFPMVEIDIEKAGAICEQAAAMSADLSVRYAFARTLVLREDWDTFDAQMKILRDADFPLSHVMAADVLWHGKGRDADRNAAREILEDHADEHPVVRHTLALFILNGSFGDEADPAAAAALYKSAMGDGFVPARVEYGKLLANGNGIDRNQRAAFRHFRTAARKGNGAGALEAARMRYFGSGVEKNHDEAYRYAVQATEHRIAEAYYFAGFMAANGQGTARNPKKAVAFLEQGAAKGNVAATGELGRMVHSGTGVNADPKRGLALIEKAAEAGDANAKSYLARLQQPLSAISGIPADQKRNLDRAMGGKPFELTNANIPFMAGVASALMSNCKNPSNITERAELAKFAGTASTAMLFGGDYSNPDLGKSMRSVAERNALQIAGTKVGAQIPCGPVSEKLAQGLLKAVRSNSRGADGGESNFVSSCQRQFTAKQCQCIADTGRVAIPDIHRRMYHRSIIKEMIQRNPLLGFTVGIACGVSNY